MFPVPRSYRSFKVSKFQGSRFQGSKDPRFQGYGFQGSRVPGFQGSKVPRIQGSRVPFRILKAASPRVPAPAPEIETQQALLLGIKLLTSLPQGVIQSNSNLPMRGMVCLSIWNRGWYKAQHLRSENAFDEMQCAGQNLMPIKSIEYITQRSPNTQHEGPLWMASMGEIHLFDQIAIPNSFVGFCGWKSACFCGWHFYLVKLRPNMNCAQMNFSWHKPTQQKLVGSRSWSCWQSLALAVAYRHEPTNILWQYPHYWSCSLISESIVIRRISEVPFLLLNLLKWQLVH